MKCRYCNNECVKNGFQLNGIQRYKCNNCKRSQQKNYYYKAYLIETDLKIYKLLINSCGISDTSRILNISRNTVSKRILLLSNKICQPKTLELNQSYEIDELKVKCFLNSNCWITYGINKCTKKVVSFVVGGRSKQYLSVVTDDVLKLHPKNVYTDKWISYKSIIPKDIHKFTRYKTNRIERNNLNLRTHLKRLSRKTICYTKSLKYLEATLKLYFWGDQLDFKY
ncbi:IS1 family transposase [Algibacter mikhailovii]|uniref:IS1 family transposase n=1 Tax=Algibacter mikhailovii TaxID=425498 RepID=UPI0024947D64|nr:IS1 family transposase [Algibacter mikhailovii]